LTGNHPISDHQHTANNRNDPVPYSWQTSGPITLAGDTQVSRRGCGALSSLSNVDVAVANRLHLSRFAPT
jgi:hypothetical protein